MAAPLDCPGIESWPALLGDTAPPDLRTRFECHLESCPACQERLDRAEDCAAALRTLGWRVGDPTAAPADATLAQVLERLHEGRPRDRCAPAEPADLYFLRPADRPGLLGLLGGYEVREVLGQGGMGVVLKAFDPALRRPVAIKVLAAAVAGSATARRRFTREAQAAAAVCHDHVVAVHGVAEADGLPYLVMQYVAGESLQQRLDRTGPLEVAEVVRIGYQTASGLAAAHAQGLIHRDIKPANILLEDGLARVKITDFGLARMADDMGLTRAGVVAGTPEYMAPEQARGEAVDHRADLFSLGSVLYACCTGLPPFHGPTALAVLHRVSEEVPAPIRSLNPAVTPWLEALVARLLAKDPARRLQRAGEVAGLLEGYLAHLQQAGTVPAPELPAPPTKARGPGRPGPRLIMALLVLGVAGLGLISWFAAAGGGPREEPDLVYYDFRGRPIPAAFTIFGDPGGTFVRAEPEGLRVTLPKERDDPSLVAVSLPVAMQGDFDVTTTFEVLHADKPARGFGVGALLTVNLVARVGCLTRPDGTEGIAWNRWVSVDGNPFGRMSMGLVPTTTKAGRLRLKRTGSVLHYLWAPGTTGGEFEEINQDEFGEDLHTVRLVAETGRQPCGLDARFLDLRIRAPNPSPGISPTPGSASRGWLTGVGIIALLVIVPFLGAWLLVRRGRRAAQAPGPDTRPRRAEAAPPVAFVCPSCGRGLEVEAGGAGKKVKCPKCGDSVAVPAIRPGGSPP